MFALDHARLSASLLPAVLDAGAELLRLRAAGVKVETKSDHSPVTAADRAAEAIILAALEGHAPEVPVLAEEEVAAGRIPEIGNIAFLVDALDGTKEFVAGGDDFTVNVALVENAAPVFGLLFAPASGRLFATLGAEAAAAAHVDLAHWRQHRVLPTLVPITARVADPKALRALSSRSHGSGEVERFFARHGIADVVRLGSSLKFGLLAAGEADIYPRFGPTSAWDIAAGHAILQAAGGNVTSTDGRPLRYPLRRGDYLNPSFIACGRGLVLDLA